MPLHSKKHKSHVIGVSKQRKNVFSNYDLDDGLYDEWSASPVYHQPGSTPAEPQQDTVGHGAGVAGTVGDQSAGGSRANPQRELDAVTDSERRKCDVGRRGCQHQRSRRVGRDLRITSEQKQTTRTTPDITRTATRSCQIRKRAFHFSFCSRYHGQTSLATYPGPNRLQNRHTYLQYPHIWSSGIPSRINFSVSTFSLIAIRQTTSPNCSNQSC